MHRKTTRWLTWLVLAALVASLLAFPAAAAEDIDDAPADEAAELLPSDEEIPLVNVIEEPSAETAEEPVAADEPSEVPEEPVEAPAEPASEETESVSDDASAEMDGDPAMYTVTYYNGEDIISQEILSEGGFPVGAPASVGGRAVKAWLDADGKRVVLADMTIEADTALYAWFAPGLKTDDHSSYINGIGSAKFAPTASLTRAQAATILYKLLASQERGPFSSTFSDVPENAWYTEAVLTLASIGVINGYADGTFRPTRAVTRAEFVTMLVNLTGVSGAGTAFTDVGSHWAAASIGAAAGQGWINGYKQSDGTYIFRPNNEITRAEAVKVVNSVLGRSADLDTIASGGDILHFIDVAATAWYYGDVMEASIGHEYTVTGKIERWTTYNAESTGLSEGVHTIDGAYVYINAKGQPVHMAAGVTKAGDEFFYSPSDGYTATGRISSDGALKFAAGTGDKTLSDGFNQIGDTLIYWSQSAHAPQALKAGLNTVAGKTYWADTDGYVIRNDFGKGPVVLGGKTYLADAYCAIITRGYAYATANSKPSVMDLRNKTYEYDGHMYYIQSDYSLLTDGWYNRLYFNEKGQYTTGDATLDAYVENVVKDFINNNSLTQVQKLLRAYYYLRGGSGETFADNGFKYRAIGEIFYWGRYYEQQFFYSFMESAKQMYSKNYGRCYEWGAGYNYLAKRLGFNAYLVVGGIFSNNATHCWNMIEWDGVWHISDVEIEWGWMSGHYGGGLKLYRNLFDQALSSQWVTSYTNPEVPTVCYKFPW